jgi:hypothetical protein
VAAPKTLKVYRTPIGFHDAYVAAPSQKAAIEAWGSDKGLFARGEAELVTDPALTAEPLASPGRVIKRLRGSAAEQIAALGEGEIQSASSAKAGTRPKREPRTKPKAEPKPRPSRAALDAAEEALAKAKERQAHELKALERREAALAAERRSIEEAQRKEADRLAQECDEAAAAYEEAMRRWRG